jgi:ribosomal protein S27AE
MELRTKVTRKFVPRPVNICAQCGDTIFMPEWSEHVDDCRVRHLWACQACGYAFETTVRFAPLSAGEIAY